ncbi:T9SS C-terminal target domain-containing protein [Aequorivita marina]|uniref:T9SS C-terminal target domain-containing protein n=1 Tax=Aequorivita marina TaxID=3073654 RepID=UPI002874D919|nr:T9SS C-terminal target domain-containing protein [Aequorivita sp. S2608]MDS1299702.1 T9SS C-terminal target domain-containing protein [Aequorivita sp. S2608]
MIVKIFKTGAYILAFIFLNLVQIQAQTGCMDSLAINYDSEVIENDGSCTYEPVLISPINSYALDSLLYETSGLIYWDNNLWTHNDNTDTNIYKLDPANGAIVDSLSLHSQVNTDWEEISQDEDYIYIGDFGNNVNGNRTDLKIIRINKSSILTGTPQMDFINFGYEDQTNFTPKGTNNTDFDCEAFIVTKTAIFLFTKQWVNNETRIYKLPKTPGTYKAELQDTYAINGLVTGAVYNKDKGVIALSGYSNFMQAFIFLLYDFKETDFFGANKRRLEVNLPFHQVEGITTNDGFNYFLTNERFDTAGTIQQLHIVDLSMYVKK